MTYFGFLLRFLAIPIVVLALLAWRDGRRPGARPGNKAALVVIGLHVLIALVYTTPWDNYLVATGVWWYDPALVTGLTLGWVPIEEYTFFVLQPILAGLWLLFLTRRLAVGDEPLRASVRVWPSLLLAVVWIAAVAILAGGGQRGVYLALILVWALPPIALQLAFGGDVLWRRRRLVIPAIISLTLYLGLADALAIGRGIWTIDPAQSLGISLGGVLPIEELIFFLLTNTLVTFGVMLCWAEESSERLNALRDRALVGR